MPLCVRQSIPLMVPYEVIPNLVPLSAILLPWYLRPLLLVPVLLARTVTVSGWSQASKRSYSLTTFPASLFFSCLIFPLYSLNHACTPSLCGHSRLRTSLPYQEDIAKAEGERVQTELVKRYTCSPEEFSAIEDFVKESPCKRLSFNAVKNCLRFILMPTIIHSAASNWLSEWGSQFPKEVKEHLQFLIEADVNGLGADGLSKKVPDNSVNVSGRAMPTIALGVGYSESYEDLVDDADLLLEGAHGRIGLVILVKVAPLTTVQQSIQSGYVQMHIYDQQTKNRAKFGSRMRLYPPTVKHAQQKITLPWQAVLREQRTTINPTTESPPPLVLDDLRRLIDWAVARTLLVRSNATAQAEANAAIL